MAFIEFGIHLLTITNFTESVKQMEFITKTYFSNESLLFIYWRNVSMEFGDELLDYWMKSEMVTVETCNCDYVTDSINWERSYVKNIVVLFGNVVPEQRHIKNIRQCVSWNARSKILAIVNSDDVVNETLGKIWTLTKAINVTIMVSKTSSVRYYTSYPYQNFKIVKLDQNRLFPPKPIKDLHGSVIKMATVGVEPYVIASQTVRNFYPDGLEIRMINFMAKKFNFKVQVVKSPPGENPWSALSSDRKRMVGNLGLLDRGEADIAVFGVQIRPDRYALADYTAIHTIDSMVWVVPIRPFSFDWRSIIIIFKTELWALLFSILILITIVLYIITKYEFGSTKTSYNAFDAFFQTFGIHISVPIYFYRKRQLYRIFVFIISYYTLIIVALYQSSLITHLTTPDSEQQIDTVEEAVDEGLIAYLYPSARPLYNQTDHELWNKILTPGKFVFEPRSAPILALVAHNKTVYTLMMNMIVQFEVQKNLLDEDHKPMVRVLPEIFLPYMVTILTAKGHPLRDLIKNNILRLFETGILTHWMRDIVLKNLKIYKGAKGSGNKGPVTISIEQLKGAFFIMLFLFLVAVIVFVCEVGYYMWKMRKFKKKI